MQFYWDKKEEDDTYISNEDVERLRDKAKQYETIITN